LGEEKEEEGEFFLFNRCDDRWAPRRRIRDHLLLGFNSAVIIIISKATST
jgi:hypothetical protein